MSNLIIFFLKITGGPPPPFMPGMPPFIPPPGELRGPPHLGRLMSPPPKRFTPIMDDRNRSYSPERGRGSGRYSPDYHDYSTRDETDYSPEPSPSPHRRSGRGYSPSASDRSRKSKGSNYIHSSYSDSDSSFDDDFD